MPYTRAQLLEAVRTDHPEFRNVDDNRLFAAIAVDHPDIAKGISDLQGGDPQGKATPLPWWKGYFSAPPSADRTAGQVASDQAANAIKGVPEAVTGIPGALSTGGNVVWNALKGNIMPLADATVGMAAPLTTTAKQAVEAIKPGVVNAPTPDAPETAQAAEGAGTILGGLLAGKGVEAAAPYVAPKVASVFDTVKAKMAPLTEPGSAALNRWMGVGPKEVFRGANPAQQLLDDKLVGSTKAATKANVDAALTDAGQQMQTALQQADKAGVKLDLEATVKKPFTDAQSKLKTPTDQAFGNRVESTLNKILDRYPNIDDLSPSEAHQLKVELGDNVNWRPSADDPLNDAFIKAYGEVNDAIKNNVNGIAAKQSRWGNLYIASKNLGQSLAEDVVGSGSGAAPPPTPLWNAIKFGGKVAMGGSGLYGSYRVLRELGGP